ncbi:hypothetical protein Trydic_g16751 [Trypoxylus dichotomus]
MEASRISGCLGDIVWRNKCLKMETKATVFKSKTQQMMRTVEMKILGSIHEKTLLDRIRSEDLRQQSRMQDVGKWMRKRRKCCNKRITRMDKDRLVKRVILNNPIGKRNPGKPSKRWTSTSEENGNSLPNTCRKEIP